VKQALSDAEVCAALRPDWEKAHFRRGMALEAAAEDNDAIAAYEAAVGAVQVY
jgi:predicted TPR repeat methyltransferase